MSDEQGAPPPGGPQMSAARGLPRIAPGRTLVGTFDAIDHGYEASGWIFDMAQPARVCVVELRIDGQAVAQVEANHPRPDLRAHRVRPESGFRISVPASVFDGVIHTAEVFLQPEDIRIGLPRPIAAVILDHKTDPKTFSVDSILKLQDGPLDYERLFTPAFLARHGVRAAVAYAYLWLLKRPPDRAGWDHYSERILAGELGIGTFLRDLANSEEAQRARRVGIDLSIEFEAVLAAAARLPVENAGRRGAG
jgi:hypothetical protein